MYIPHVCYMNMYMYIPFLPPLYQLALQWSHIPAPIPSVTIEQVCNLKRKVKDENIYQYKYMLLIQVIIHVHVLHLPEVNASVLHWSLCHYVPYNLACTWNIHLEERQREREWGGGKIKITKLLQYLSRLWLLFVGMNSHEIHQTSCIFPDIQCTCTCRINYLLKWDYTVYVCVCALAVNNIIVYSDFNWQHANIIIIPGFTSK